MMMLFIIYTGCLLTEKIGKLTGSKINPGKPGCTNSNRALHLKFSKKEYFLLIEIIRQITFEFSWFKIVISVIKNHSEIITLQDFIIIQNNI